MIIFGNSKSHNSIPCRFFFLYVTVSKEMNALMSQAEAILQ